jgi:metallo-beta-lactamase class B
MKVQSAIVFCSAKRRVVLQAAVLLTVLCALGVAQEGSLSLPRRPNRGSRPSPIVPTKPFHIVGNIYYVGQTDNSKPGADDAAYLITTPEGHILLNTALEQDFKQIPPNIQKIGFRLEDIKFLVHSHSHADHVGGDVLLKKAVPGVKILAMKGDAEVMASGGKTDFDPHRRTPGFPALRVDRILKDGDTVQLGGTTMVAHLTAGHTEGCTTWSMVVEDGGRKYDTVFLCSGGYHPGVKLVNDSYPNMVADYLRAFRVMKSLKVAVYLSAHGADTRLVEKAIRLEKGAKPNPFIDPAGYKAVVEEMEKEFLTEMKKQGVTAPPGI